MCVFKNEIQENSGQRFSQNEGENNSNGEKVDKINFVPGLVNNHSKTKGLPLKKRRSSKTNEDGQGLLSLMKPALEEFLVSLLFFFAKWQNCLEILGLKIIWAFGDVSSDAVRCHQITNK